MRTHSIPMALERGLVHRKGARSRRLLAVFALSLGLTLALMCLLGAGLRVARAATFTVTTFADDYDGVCNAHHCSLRGASNTAASGAGGTVLLQNTIVAYNGTNCNAALTSNGHNLESGHTCGLSASGDRMDTDPLLGPLTADGGTLVHPLRAGSPAIDHRSASPESRPTSGVCRASHRATSVPTSTSCTSTCRWC